MYFQFVTFYKLIHWNFLHFALCRLLCNYSFQQPNPIEKRTYIYLQRCMPGISNGNLRIKVKLAFLYSFICYFFSFVYSLSFILLYPQMDLPLHQPHSMWTKLKKWYKLINPRCKRRNIVKCSLFLGANVKRSPQPVVKCSFFCTNTFSEKQRKREQELRRLRM